MIDPPRPAVSPASIWSHRLGMTLLLATLVVLAFVVPVFARRDVTGPLLLDIVFTLVILTGVGATGGRRGRGLLVAVALAAVLLRWMPWTIPGLSAPVLRESASLATLVMLAGLVAVKVFESGAVTMDRVMGAVVLYLLLGLCWAMVYAMVAAGDPAAFSGDVRDATGVHRWIYFSFVTLTTVGFGDITPASDAARSLTVLEALVGQLYPTILLGRLVSLMPGADQRR